METQSPQAINQANIATQQARVETFMADNPGIDLNTPAPPDPKVEIVAPGDNPTAPPEANTPPESAHPATEHPTRRGFHEAALTGLAIAGGVAGIAVNLVAEAMDQETYEQARI